MSRQKIRLDGEPRYFAMIPNMATDDLNPFQLALYVHYKRVAGENGQCEEGTRTTAQKTKMSMGKVNTTRRELAALGYIVLTEPATKNNPKETITIDIVNRWAENSARYDKKHGAAHEVNTNEGDDTSTVHVVNSTVHVVNTSPVSTVHVVNERIIEEEKPAEKAKVTPPQPGETVTPTVSKKAAAAAYESQTETYALAFRAYEECFGLTLNPSHADQIKDYIDNEKMPVQWIVDALQEAVDYNVRKWKYVVGILENWRQKGRTPKPTNGNGAGEHPQQRPDPDCPQCNGSGYYSVSNGMAECGCRLGQAVSHG